MSIPSSPEAETHSGLASPRLVDNEMDFADPDVNLQSQSVPMQEIFEKDSSIGVYKTITGEVLRIVFKGILNWKYFLSFLETKHGLGNCYNF